jgi:hypothetical protein
MYSNLTTVSRSNLLVSTQCIPLYLLGFVFLWSTLLASSESKGGRGNISVRFRVFSGQLRLPSLNPEVAEAIPVYIG